MQNKLTAPVSCRCRGMFWGLLACPLEISNHQKGSPRGRLGEQVPQCPCWEQRWEPSAPSPGGTGEHSCQSRVWEDQWDIASGCETQAMNFWCSCSLHSVKYPLDTKYQHLGYLGPPLKERTLQHLCTGKLNRNRAQVWAAACSHSHPFTGGTLHRVVWVTSTTGHSERDTWTAPTIGPGKGWAWVSPSSLHSPPSKSLWAHVVPQHTQQPPSAPWWVFQTCWMWKKTIH